MESNGGKAFPTVIIRLPVICWKGGVMKKEDRYLLLVIGFIVGWIVLMGMGGLG